MAPKKVIGKILDTIGSFSYKCTPQTLTDIRVVIFKSEDCKTFQNVMKEFQGKPVEETKGVISKVLGKASAIGSTIKTKITGNNEPDSSAAGWTSHTKLDTLTLNFYSDSKANIGGAVKKLQTYIREETTEHIIHKNVQHLSDEDFKNIVLSGLQHNVAVRKATKSGTPTLVIKGLGYDVLAVQRKANSILDELATKIHEKRQKDLAKNVRWKFGDDGTFEDYDERVTGIIEMAHVDKKPSVDFEIDGGKYRIVFKDMQEIDLHNMAAKVSVRRVEKQSGVPANWDPMPPTGRFKSVPLDPKSQEYQDVDAYFRKTYTPKQTVQIQRIQNENLYRQYMVNKETLEIKNPPGTQNERKLFHGTSADSIDKINAGGFNRSFAGKNATAYGKGTYFAVQASYSASGYAESDSSGTMNMYLARVLTGMYTVGNSKMIEPPPKNPKDALDCYDSVVNNQSNPIMFVVFRDAVAYPEYLITFK